MCPLFPTPKGHNRERDAPEMGSPGEDGLPGRCADSLGGGGGAATTTAKKSWWRRSQHPANSWRDDDILTLKNCGHAFHTICLSSWFLTERHDCPVCRGRFWQGMPKARQEPRSRITYGPGGIIRAPPPARVSPSNGRESFLTRWVSSRRDSSRDSFEGIGL
jgi:hypothetical protein